MLGPPPPEVAGRFKVLKSCVILLVVALCFKILFWVVTSHEMSIFTSSLNMLLNIVVGIFLFNDDADFKPIYDCMLNTCCQGCHDQCPYGTGCLMTFVLVNAIDLLFTILYVYRFNEELQIILDPSDARSDSQYVGAFLYIVSQVITSLAQIVIVYQGWRAHQEILQSGVSTMLGDFDRYDPHDRPGGGQSAGRSNWGQGSWGSSSAADRDRQDDREGAPPSSTGASTGRPTQSFEVFGGQGHRLGD